jgi:hypothetical protein
VILHYLAPLNRRINIIGREPGSEETRTLGQVQTLSPCAKCGQMIHLLHGGRERQRLRVVTNLAIALSTIEIGVEEGASAAETCPLPEDDKRGEDEKRKEVQRDQQTASRGQPSSTLRHRPSIDENLKSKSKIVTPKDPKAFRRDPNLRCAMKAVSLELGTL